MFFVYLQPVPAILLRLDFVQYEYERFSAPEIKETRFLGIRTKKCLANVPVDDQVDKFL